MANLTTKYDFSKLSPFEIKWKDVSFYLQQQTGRSEIPTRGYTIFYVSETQVPKSIVIFVYGYYSKKEYGQIEGIDYLEFYKGEYRIRETLGALGQFFLFDSLSSDEPLVFCPCFNPYDENGNLQLYDEYSYAVLPTVNSEAIYHQVQNRIYNQTNVRSEAFACRLYIPESAPFIQINEKDNELISNIAQDGNFTTALLNLPIKNFGSKYQLLAGQIRDLITPITSNIYYNFSSDATFNGYEVMKDILSIVAFTDFNDEYYTIESLPKNYLSIQGFPSNPVTPDFKSLTIRIDGNTAIRNRSIVISFAAKNLNPSKLQNLPIRLYWREFDGTRFSRVGAFDFDQIILTDTWAKYTAIVKQPLPNPQDRGDGSQNTFVEVQLRLPNNAEFELGITNLLVDYGVQEINYPRVDNSILSVIPSQKNVNQQVIWTNSGIMPIVERPGVITPALTPIDSETTIFADGRIIHADDVYEFNETDAEGFNVGPTISTAFSKSNKKGLYDLLSDIGYPDGTGDDYVTYSDLTTGPYSADATDLGVSGILEFNKPKFNPPFEIVYPGTPRPVTAEVFHKSQDYPQDFWFKAFIEKDNKDNIWFGASTNNYLAEFFKNGGNEVVLGSFSDSLTSSSAINGIATMVIVAGLSNTHLSDIGSQLKFPMTTYKNMNYPGYMGSNYGNININLIDTSESATLAYSNNSSTSQSAKIPNTLSLLVNNRGYTRASGAGADIVISSNLQLKITKTDLPTTNPAFSVVPNDRSNNTYKSSLIANDNPINVYYSNDKDNVVAAIGTNLSAKRILLPTFIKNVFGVKFNITSNTILDYRGIYFTFECDAKRNYNVKTFANGKGKNTLVTEDDGKFCFYFFTGTETRPSVDPSYRAIPINIVNATSIADISKAIENTINLYRIAIPDLRGFTLVGSGRSDFDNSIQNNVTQNYRPNIDTILCRNLRNKGYKIPKNNISSTPAIFHSLSYDNIGGAVLTSDYLISSTENKAVINYHISLC